MEDFSFYQAIEPLILGFSWGLFFIALATAYAIFKAVRNKYSGRGLSGKAEKLLMKRLDELEQRMTDSQAIILSIDEKLESFDLLNGREKPVKLKVAKGKL